MLGGLAIASSALMVPTADAARSAKLIEVEASWEMNEPAEATTMVDSGPNGHDATVDQSGIDTGFCYDGATGYRWLWRDPIAPPASPERVIVIPDHPDLDPLDDIYHGRDPVPDPEQVRQHHPEGPGHQTGGQWKIQNPGGRPSCLYNGSIRRGAVRAVNPLNDNAWHVLRCVKTPTAVELWVDGVRVGRKNGAVGNIDNNWPMTIGGKSSCNQEKVTCDYFSGEIDYVRLYRGS